MSLAEFITATYNFEDDNIIGFGRTEIMYKPVLSNGWSLAIRRLHHDSLDFEKEFITELLTLGMMRHSNLVPLLGFCFELKETLLVYRYMPCDNLHDWLHSEPKGDPPSNEWPLRLKIAVGIARGLAWLDHNSSFQVSHNSISSKCILLDQSFEPKISNFGDAMFVNLNGTPSSSWISLVNHRFSDPVSYKNDVYCFGIVLLELVTRKEPCQMVNSQIDLHSNLVECVNQLLNYRSSDPYDVFDECSIGQGFEEEVFQLLRIAQKCIQLEY